MLGIKHHEKNLSIPGPAKTNIHIDVLLNLNFTISMSCRKLKLQTVYNYTLWKRHNRELRIFNIKDENVEKFNDQLP